MIASNPDKPRVDLATTDPITVKSVARRARVALCGSMSDVAKVPPELVGRLHGNEVYKYYTKSKVLFSSRDRLNGVSLEGSQLDTRKSRGKNISYTPVVGLQATPGNAIPALAMAGVQLWPWLVSNGRNVASRTTDTTVEWRCATGIHRDGRVMYFCLPCSMWDLAEAMIEAGCVEGGYNDGGGSGKMIIDGELVVGASEDRRLHAVIVAQDNRYVPKTGPAVALTIAGGVGLLASALLVSKLS